MGLDFIIQYVGCPVLILFTYGWNEEWDPGHHDEHGWGEVHRQDEGSKRSREVDLEPINTVVTLRKEWMFFSKNYIYYSISAMTSWRTRLRVGTPTGWRDPTRGWSGSHTLIVTWIYRDYIAPHIFVEYTKKTKLFSYLMVPNSNRSVIYIRHYI